MPKMNLMTYLVIVNVITRTIMKETKRERACFFIHVCFLKMKRLAKCTDKRDQRTERLSPAHPQQELSYSSVQQN